MTFDYGALTAGRFAADERMAGYEQAAAKAQADGFDIAASAVGDIRLTR